MPKPSEVINWASGGGALLAAPSPSKIALGWEEEFPPADWWNYVWKNQAAWNSWLNTFESTAHTWTALQTFEELAVEDLEVEDLTVNGDAVFPAVGTVDFQGSTGFTGTGSTHAVAGTIAVASTGKITIANNPASNVAVANAIYGKSVVKAWARVTINHTVGATVTAGLNVSAVNIGEVSSFHNVTVHFAAPMAVGVKYVVNFLVKETLLAGVFALAFPTIVSQDNTKFTFHVVVMHTTSLYIRDFSAEDLDVEFTVSGEQ